MNERIKQLAEQAGASYYNTYTGPLLSPKDIEKFAELIVLECEKAMKNPKWYSESPSNGLCKPIRFACITIKEHFGVEE